MEQQFDALTSKNKKLLQFHNQTVVDDIYNNLTSEKRDAFSDIYNAVSNDNKGITKGTYNFSIKVKYFLQKNLSLILSIIGRSAFGATFLAFLHIFVIRSWEPSLNVFKKVLEIGQSFIGTGLFPADMPFDINMVTMEMPIGPTAAPQLLNEFSIYFTFMTLVLILLNIAFFFYKTTKVHIDNKKNPKEIEEMPIDKAFHKLDCDEFDSLKYVQSSFMRKYTKNINKRNIQEQYVKAYASVISNHKFIEEYENNHVQSSAIFKTTVWRGTENLIGLFCFASLFLVAWYFLLIRFGDGFYILFGMTQNSFMELLLSLSERISTSLNLHALPEKVFAGEQLAYHARMMHLGIVVSAFAFVIGIRKRFISPTYREYERSRVLYSLLNKGLVEEDSYLRNKSPYHFFFTVFLVFVLPVYFIVKLGLL